MIVNLLEQSTGQAYNTLETKLINHGTRLPGTQNIQEY